MKKSNDKKEKTLQDNRCLNPHPETITCELFTENDFFDQRDLLQVKYEMVRKIQNENAPIRQVAGQFGFSRPSIYKALTDFKEKGIFGLLQKKSGPHHAHKLKEDVIKFIKKQKCTDSSITLKELVYEIKYKFGITVHLRSIQRVLKEKKNYEPRA